MPMKNGKDPSHERHQMEQRDKGHEKKEKKKPKARQGTNVE